jgi:hypothetical protein
MVPFTKVMGQIRANDTLLLRCVYVFECVCLRDGSVEPLKSCLTKIVLHMYVQTHKFHIYARTHVTVHLSTWYPTPLYMPRSNDRLLWYFSLSTKQTVLTSPFLCVSFVKLVSIFCFINNTFNQYVP